jgi:peptidoglycan/LPS O-acetylase OafA/YrhL
MGRYEGGWDATSYDHRAMGELGSMAALLLVAALVIVVARSRAPRLVERRDLLAFVLIACTVPFWLRTSWSHYFVHLPLAQTLLAGMLAERSSSRSRARDVLVLVVLVAPSVFLSNVLGLFATEGWWYYANAGSLFFANALVLLACAGVIVDAHVRFVASERRAPETGGAIL